jgi:hypothetical protein
MSTHSQGRGRRSRVLAVVAALLAGVLVGAGGAGGHCRLPWRMGLLTRTNSTC